MFPTQLKLRKSTFTRLGEVTASPRSSELKIVIAVPSAGAALSQVIDFSEPAPGIFCTIMPG